MKLILYILIELTLGLLFALAGIFVVALPVIAVAAVSKLSGVNTLGVLRYMPILIATLVPYVLPLSYLLAVVSTYGRLAADNEWTAIRMAGIQPLKMLIPALVLGLVCAAATYWMLAEQLPHVRKLESGFKFSALREQVKQLPRNETEIKLGKFYLSSAWRDGDDFIDAVINLPAHKKEPARKLRARRVRIDFTDKDVYIRLHQAEVVFGEHALSNENPTFRIDIEQLMPTKKQLYSGFRHRTSEELQAMADDPALPQQDRNRSRFEYQNRRAFSATFLMFLLLGAPTGLLLRRGTQLGALSVAIGYALLYYLLSMRLSKELAAGQVIPPVIGAWMVVSVGCLAGVFLLRKALRT